MTKAMGMSPDRQASALVRRACSLRLLAVLAILLGGLIATDGYALPPRIYASPAADGVPPVFSPVPLPANATLDLWIETGANDSDDASEEVCFDGSGDELCAWHLEIEVTGGATITSFVENFDLPGRTLEYSTPDPTHLRLLRLDASGAEAGDEGRLRIGSLAIVNPGGGEVVLTSASSVVDADLELISLATEVIASPEPGGSLPVFAGLLATAGWARRRRQLSGSRVAGRGGAPVLAIAATVLICAPSSSHAQQAITPVEDLCLTGGTHSYRPEAPALPVVTSTVSGYACADPLGTGVATPFGTSISITSTHPMEWVSVPVGYRGSAAPQPTVTVVLSDGLGLSVVSEIVLNGGDSLFLPSTGSTAFSLAATDTVELGVIDISHRPHCGDDFVDGSDPDGDGLPTSWERCGLKVIERPDPAPDITKVCRLEPCSLDLAAMGADPLTKDVFVEVDWMRKGPHRRSHWPRRRAVKQVVESFLDAPVSNPSGATGIRLHLDAGPRSIMNPDTGERWRDLSRSNSIAHLDRLGACEVIPDDLSDPADGCGLLYATIWDEFDRIRDGTTVLPRNFEAARKSVFRYGLFAHRVDGPATGVEASTGGLARDAPASDFISSLGDWNGSGTGDVLEQGTTLMHELGHTLGLEHGGRLPEPDFKPNYLSVMNYSFATTGLLRLTRGNGLQYSRWSLPDLDEFALVETNGIDGDDSDNAAALAGWGTRWSCPPGVCTATGVGCSESSDCAVSETCLNGMCSGSAGYCIVDAQCPGAELCALGTCSASGNGCADSMDCPVSETCVGLDTVSFDSLVAQGAKDWNCDGEDSIATPIQSDINASADSESDLEGGWNDWENLVYVAGSVGGLAPGPSATPVRLTDMPFEILSQIRDERAVDVQAQPDIALRPGGTAAIEVTVRNTGRIADTYSVVLASSGGWASVSGPPVLALDVDQEAEFVVNVSVPAGAVVGAEDEVGLEVTSLSDAEIQETDTTIVEVISCGDVTRSGGVDEKDVDRLLEALLFPLERPLSNESVERCSVIGSASDCDLVDLVVLDREVVSAASQPGIAQVCGSAVP